MQGIPDADSIGPKRIYVAGPMTGIERWNFPAFQRAGLFLRALGHIAVVPSEIDKAIWGFDGEPDLPASMERRRILSLDVGVVLPTCDVIYMLRGWHYSSGAIAEKATAETYGIDTWYEVGALHLNICDVVGSMGMFQEVTCG
jgi:hypothetical protein